MCCCSVAGLSLQSTGLAGAYRSTGLPALFLKHAGLGFSRDKCHLHVLKGRVLFCNQRYGITAPDMLAEDFQFVGQVRQPESCLSALVGGHSLRLVLSYCSL